MPAPLPQPDDRIRVTGVMPEDPEPIPVGEEGTVTDVQPEVGQIHVDWDSGRRLILLTTDPFEIVAPE